MSKRSAFNPQTFSLKRKTFQVNSFLGVDYSSQRFNVSSNRAIDLLNFIYKDGVIQKRNGYEEIFKILPTNYLRYNFDKSQESSASTNTTSVHNIWSFVAEDNQTHIVAHIGKLLYEIKNIDEYNMSIVPIKAVDIDTQVNGVAYPLCYEFEDTKTQGFVGANKFWFLGGNRYMVLRFIANKTILIPVEESEFASIPTTTISITYENAKSSQRQSYDKVNLLQKFRKNKFISGVGKNEELLSNDKYYTYTLDSPLITENEDLDMQNFSMIINERGKTN